MTNIFNNISLKHQEKILKNLRGHYIYYKAGDVIIDHLRDEDDIGILLDGRVQVIKNNYNGTTTIIEEFNQNSVVSFLNIYLKENDTQIIAKEDTTIMLFSYNTISNIDPYDKMYNQFVKNMYLALNDSIIAKNERIDILTKRTIREKLFVYFNTLSRKNGSRYIYLPSTFSELANYIGVDRSAMSREIGYLKEEGFISVKGKKITLLYR